MEPTAASLNTNDVFALKSPQSTFLWRGMGASEEEMTAAKYVANFLGGSATEVLEGKEPGEGPQPNTHTHTLPPSPETSPPLLLSHREH